MKKSKDPVKAVEQKALEHESKHAKSVRIIVGRVNKALKAIKLVGNCSTKDYELTAEEQVSVTDIMQAALDTVKNQFAGTVGHETSFSL